MTTRKTLIAIKITTGRVARQLWDLAMIMIVLVAIGAVVGAAQVVICHRDHPGETIINCLRGVHR